MHNVIDLGVEAAALVGEYNILTMLRLAEEISQEDFSNHAGYMRNFEPWIKLRITLFELSLRLQKPAQAEAAEAEAARLRTALTTVWECCQLAADIGKPPPLPRFTIRDVEAALATTDNSDQDAAAQGA